MDKNPISTVDDCNITSVDEDSSIAVEDAAMIFEDDNWSTAIVDSAEN